MFIFINIWKCLSKIITIQIKQNSTKVPLFKNAGFFYFCIQFDLVFEQNTTSRSVAQKYQYMKYPWCAWLYIVHNTQHGKGQISTGPNKLAITPFFFWSLFQMLLAFLLPHFNTLVVYLKIPVWFTWITCCIRQKEAGYAEKPAGILHCTFSI